MEISESMRFPDFTINKHFFFCFLAHLPPVPNFPLTSLAHNALAFVIELTLFFAGGFDHGCSAD